MSRIFASARKLAEREGLDLDTLVDAGKVRGSGSNDAVTKSDVQEYLISDDHLPSKEELIRIGLERGLSNVEIGERVREVYGEQTKWDAGRVSWTIGVQRRNHTSWWQAHGPRVVVERGVKPGELPEHALEEARDQYGEGS